MAQTKTIQFRPKEFDALLSKLGLAGIWKAKEGDNLLVVCIAEPPLIDAAKEFHIQRGCCDGSDVAKCYAERVAKEKKERKPAKPREPRIPKEPRFVLPD